MHENQLSRYGAIAKMLPFTTGKTFFVLDSADAQYAEFQNEFPADRDGVDRVYSTIAAAYAAMTTNRNDVCVLDANSQHDLTAMLDISKNRCHFIGADLGGRMYGQRARVAIGVTTDTDDIAAVKNTGVGNTFRNIKFSSSNTLTEGVYTFAEGGEYSYFENCEFYLSSQLDATGAAEILLNGDSAQFKNCTIGSLVNATTGTIIRPNVLASRETITGKVARDCTFINCNFWRKSGHVNNRFVYGSGATDVERIMQFENCKFINAKLAAAVPAQAIAFGSAQTEGYILVKDCAFVNVTKPSTTTGVMVCPVNDASGFTELASQRA